MECKSAWPDATGAARRIAGHANAAQGQSILWIIGLDEKAHKVTGANDVDTASWWQQVESRFDQLPPALVQDLVVPTGEGLTVVALEMNTDRAPYVVTTDGKTAVHREVPFRSATGLRTAHRDEIMRMLAPVVALPTAELVSGDCTVTLKPADPGGIRNNRTYAERPEPELWISASLSALLHPREPALLPRHRGSATFAIHPPDGSPFVFPTKAGVAPAGQSYQPAFGNRPGRVIERGAELQPAGVFIDAADVIRADSHLHVPATGPGVTAAAEDAPFVVYEVTLHVAGSDAPLVLSAKMPRTYPDLPVPSQPVDPYDDRFIAQFSTDVRTLKVRR